MSEPAQLASKLSDEGSRMVRYLTELSRSDFDAEVYAEGELWTVRSILAHLMTAERSFVILFDRIRHGGGGVSEDFAIDRYNASQQRKTSELTPGQLLEQYAAARAAMVELVRGFTNDDLERKGRHPYLGITTLREMVKMIYIHNQTHYRDIRRVLKKE